MNTILFDLDGTLLPMNQDDFLKVYIGELSKKMAGYGFEPTHMVKALWDGTSAMRDNDGTVTNAERFWQRFAAHLGEKVLKMKPVLERFYAQEFNNAKFVCGENPLAKKLLLKLRKKGYKLVLASNPVFPRRAYESRLNWLGLDTSYFDYLTSYNNSHYCKPNPLYYREILANIGKKPEECLMVGNDVQEDMCATSLGLDFYLITDCIINTNRTKIPNVKSGSFEQFAGWADELPKIS